MTEFSRSGYRRTSKYGVRHWVNPHTVIRYHWDRSAGRGAYSYGRRTLDQYQASHGWVSTFVNPNAHCPVCGASVFYYQNQFGSRVYFDELGPPWPKHPCTDGDDALHGRSNRRTRGNQDEVAPRLRNPNEIESISSATKSLGVDRGAEFRIRYGTSPWTPLLVTKAYRSGAACLIAALPYGDPNRRPVYLEFESPKNLMHTGDTFFRRRRRISVFDKKQQVPSELAVIAIMTPRAFIERIPSGV